MHLVGPVAELLPLLELAGDVRVAGGGDEGREPVKAGDQPVLDLARRDVARPADDHRRSEATLEHGALAAGERRLATVGPGEVLGAVVGGEPHDRVVIDAQVASFFITDRRCRRSAPCPPREIDHPFSGVRIFSYFL